MRSLNIFLTLFHLLFLSSSSFTLSSTHVKNVVFIVADDLRPQLSTYRCLDCERMVTPNLEAFSEHSLTFSRAYANQALCGPSRTSFLTSRRPDSTKLIDQDSHYWRRAIGNFTTLPQFFKERGYETASFGKVFHPGRASGFTDDFPWSWSQYPYHPASLAFENAATCPGLRSVGQSVDELFENVACAVDVETQPMGTLPDLETNDAALNFVRKIKNSSRPFFLAVGYHKPHIPFRIPKRYLSLYPLNSLRLPSTRTRPSSMPEVAWNPWNDLRRRDDVTAIHPPFPFGPLPDDFQRINRQHYFAAVSYVDDLFGRLLFGLIEEMPNLHKNTIILFTGDHGWSLGEHGEWAKYSNFEAAVQVPLVIFDPESPRADGLQEFSLQDPFRRDKAEKGLDRINVTDRFVELVDLMPTLVEMAVKETIPICPQGSAPELCTEGTSFFSEFSTSKRARRKDRVFSQFPRPGPRPTAIPNSDEPRLNEVRLMGYSILTRDYRYGEWIDFNVTSMTGDFSKMMARELYDLRLDPGENENVAELRKYVAVRERLARRLREGWRSG